MERQRHCPGIYTVLIGIILLVVSACSGGGEGGSDGPPPTSGGGGWVTVLSSGGPSPFEEYCNGMNLSGEAFISSRLYRCCSGSASDTAVQVTWQNLTTGDSGAASQTVRICYFLGSPFLCDHSWYASIPLRVGSNTIRIRSAEEAPGTAWAMTDFVVNHPEASYQVTGHLLTSDGRPLWWYESGIEMRLLGTAASTRVLTNPDGSYSVSCVRSGSYSMIPTSPLGQTYSPPVANLTVNGADVPGVDFATDVHFVSGSVSWASSGALSANEQIVLESAAGSVTTHTNAQGAYRVAAPNGSYTVRITPYAPITFSPTDQAVTISGADVAGINFTKQ